MDTKQKELSKNLIKAHQEWTMARFELAGLGCVYHDPKATAKAAKKLVITARKLERCARALARLKV